MEAEAGRVRVRDRAAGGMHGLGRPGTSQGLISARAGDGRGGDMVGQAALGKLGAELQVLALQLAELVVPRRCLRRCQWAEEVVIRGCVGGFTGKFGGWKRIGTQYSRGRVE